MCGIVGYIGKTKAVPIILDGLTKLEYRGYDSAGVAVLNPNGIEIYKSVGKILNLKKLIEELPEEQSSTTVGIGHTRWATHGIPSEDNAHPHTNSDKTIALVHNGIIENYKELRESLSALGHKFISATDTETIVHLISEKRKNSKNLLKAVQEALKDLKGDFAITVMSQDEPDKLIVAKNHAPLVIGLGEGENYVASDVPAMLNYTKNVIYLDNMDVGVITRDSVVIYDQYGEQVHKKVEYIPWEPVTLEKMGFKHFMLKEIHEQPSVIKQVFSGRLVDETSNILLDEVKLSSEYIENISRILIVACGTSYHASLVGKYAIEKLTHIPVEVEIASEIIDRNVLVDQHTLVIAVSQSGETADTIMAINKAKEQKAHILVITNRIDSHMATLADSLIHVRAGIEISVAATKSYIAQVCAFYLLALYLAEIKKSVSESLLVNIKLQLMDIPQHVEHVLNNLDLIQKCSYQYYKYKNFIFISRGINYPTVLEGALKLKEISYINATGYPAGELKHGPIAMLDHTMPVMAVVTQGKTYQKVISNCEEAKARDAKLIAIATYGDHSIKSIFDNIIYVPAVDEIVSPIINAIPLQLFAYYIANFLGKDIDQPRNLAKTVTVQ